MPVKLRLLGGVAIVDGDAVRQVALDRPVSLLIYLAMRGTWVSRSELALLYRPDAPEEEAHGYVRKLVFRARKVGWAGGLEVAGGRVRWLAESDVAEFESAIGGKRWREALGAYRGPFLDGAALPGAPGFAGWQEMEREQQAARWLRAAITQAAELNAAGRFGESADLLGQVVEAEPLAEEHLQAYLRALAAAGREREGLKAFERFRRELESEVGAAPLESTRALVAGLREAAPGSSALAHRRRAGELLENLGSLTEANGDLLCALLTVALLLERQGDLPAALDVARAVAGSPAGGASSSVEQLRAAELRAAAAKLKARLESARALTGRARPGGGPEASGVGSERAGASPDVPTPARGRL